MNARQKAKKYKKELDFYKTTTFKPCFVYERKEIKKFRSQMCIPMFEYSMVNSDPAYFEWVQNNLSRMLFDEIKPLIKFNEQRNFNNMVVFSAEISVSS